MNPVKDTIGWADFTLNPTTGCKHNCPYCYARAFAGRKMGRYATTGFLPYFHRDRLEEPSKRKKPARIFVGSAGDLCGDWDYCEYGHGNLMHTGSYVVRQIAEAMRKAPQHQYLVLTKADLYRNGLSTACAKELSEAGAWLGISITGHPKYDADERMRLVGLLDTVPTRRFVSVEPIMIGGYYSHSLCDLMTRLELRKIDWLIIGGMTGAQRKRHHPDKSKEIAEMLIEHAKRAGVPVYCKSNLGYAQEYKEFPKP